MAKFYGPVGYADTNETSPGVWVETITERMYYGDLIRNTRKLQNSEKVNNDVIINNDVRIVSDPYAIQNFQCIRYVKINDVAWTVTNIDVQYPRLYLTLGGVWNGQQA